MDPINPTHRSSVEKHSEISFEICIQTPPTLYDDYFDEVKSNIQRDKNLLSEKFLIRGEIHAVKIEQAGDETHFKGKLSLFLTLKTYQDELKVLYKPRSVLPEKILEEFLTELTQIRSRTILNCGEYGYDTYVFGSKLVDKNKKLLRGKGLHSKLIELANKNPANKTLIAVMNFMNFEDTHADNFILDRQGILHFIDAEAYQTKMAANLKEVYESKEFQKDLVLEEQVKEKINLYIGRIKQVPTRLILCSTRAYLFPLYSTPKKIKIGDFFIPNNEQSFKNFHVGLVAQFLFNFNLLTPYQDMSFEDLTIEVNKAFHEPNAIRIIERELDAVSELRKYGELPAFRFHLIENWIECPVTNVRLHLKTEDE